MYLYVSGFFLLYKCWKSAGWHLRIRQLWANPQYWESCEHFWLDLVAPRFIPWFLVLVPTWPRTSSTGLAPSFTLATSPSKSVVCQLWKTVFDWFISIRKIWLCKNFQLENGWGMFCALSNSQKSQSDDDQHQHLHLGGCLVVTRSLQILWISPCCQIHTRNLRRSDYIAD